MWYIWWSIVAITLFIDINLVNGEESIPTNFTVVLTETMKKFQLQGYRNPDVSIDHRISVCHKRKIYGSISIYTSEKYTL